MVLGLALCVNFDMKMRSGIESQGCARWRGVGRESRRLGGALEGYCIGFSGAHSRSHGSVQAWLRDGIVQQNGEIHISVDTSRATFPQPNMRRRNPGCPIH